MEAKVKIFAEKEQIQTRHKVNLWLGEMKDDIVIVHTTCYYDRIIESYVEAITYYE